MTPFEFLHPAEQIVAIMNRIYENGMTTTSGGNLSVLDPDGDMWICKIKACLHIFCGQHINPFNAGPLCRILRRAD